MFDRAPDPTKAAACCCQLIQAYLADPEHVDWNDVQTALDAALDAFGLPATFIEENEMRAA
ncbi:hypothetical protein ACRQ1B_28165 [Rhizobium panacihumi]|uniref:hypothetical protein n=1 Tax=Rhizobium panacihumi TaxID=2008450 RepID=UPI003D7BD43C